jgi:hypothetical protein
MPQEYRIVPISPRTGKEIKSPRKKQNILYAIKGPRGGIKLLRKEPQKFYKTDLQGLNNAVSKTKGGNFVVYEQRTRTPLRDKKGKPILTKSGKKKYQTKLSYAQPRRKQLPLLYSGNKKLRGLDVTYKKGNYKKARYMREMTVAKVNQKAPVQLVLKGNTIKQALESLQLAVSLKQFNNIYKSGFGLYYSIMIVIKGPGVNLKIPVNSSYRNEAFDYMNSSHTLPGDKKRSPALSNEIKILANLHSEMSYSIRRALRDAGEGYRFTSLATLKQIENREMRIIKKLEKDGVNQDVIDRRYNAIDRLWNLGWKSVKELKQLTGAYSVTLYVWFEQM